MSKAIVTLKRFYVKEIEISIPRTLHTGMSDEEIADLLIEKFNPIPDDEELEEMFNQAPLSQLDLSEVDSDGEDRYDIYNEDGIQTYGGHL
tara:strand:- start:10371 stop:10643 length:273 start_codon:yes stop_codon:yes gene_type:complete